MNVDEAWDEAPSELALPVSFIRRYERKNEPELITTYMCLYVCGGGEERFFLRGATCRRPHEPI